MMMESSEFAQIFQMLKQGTDDVISTDVFIQTFRESMGPSAAQELDNVVRFLDPKNTGRITYDQFVIAMKKLYDNNGNSTTTNGLQDHQEIYDDRPEQRGLRSPASSPETFFSGEERNHGQPQQASSPQRVSAIDDETFKKSHALSQEEQSLSREEILDTTQSGETLPVHHSQHPRAVSAHLDYEIRPTTISSQIQLESLNSFGDDSLDDAYVEDFIKFNNNFSGDEAKTSDDDLLGCERLSPQNMSLLDNQTSAREEHYEFTPSPESGSKRHAPTGVGTQSDFPPTDDTDFSCISNGDSSYHSLKSPSFGPRNTWLRSSVRRNESLKRNGSLANYRNSPTQDRSSSRRSSLSYESDEMINSDGQLEEDVQNLNDKLKKLQDQIELLTNAQERSEVKYGNMLRENGNLNDKINYLEEQIRDFDLKSEQRGAEEDKRHREAMERLSREKSQEVESLMESFVTAQKELLSAQNDIKLAQQQIDDLRCKKVELESHLQDRDYEIQKLKDEINDHEEVIQKRTDEVAANSALIEALNRELATAKSPSAENSHTEVGEPNVEIINRNQELEQQLRMMKQENTALKEVNEELTAQVLNNHLIEGKNLLKEPDAGSSLAAELGNLDSEELKNKLREKEEETAKLKEYIDKMLEKIVIHYPKLLEVGN